MPFTKAATSIAKSTKTASSTTSTKNPLLSPFRIRNVQFKNRVVSTSHAPNYVEDALPKSRYQLYHEEKAKGGLALTMFGGSSNVSLDSPSVFGQIDISTDAVIPYFDEFSDRIHQHDCKIMCQLTHMGRRTSYDVGNWTCPVGVSPIREHSHRAFPKELDGIEIERIIDDFASAAYRCKAGGLDGIELLASAHLIDQFISPATNKRNDEYGGCLENRMRFVLNVLNACRDAVGYDSEFNNGNDFLIGIRMNISEIDSNTEILNNDYEGIESNMDFQGFYTIDSGIEIGKKLIETGQLDFINANIGEAGSLSGLSRLLPNMAHKLSPHLDHVAKFRLAMNELSKNSDTSDKNKDKDNENDNETENENQRMPLFHAGRIMDVSTARYVIESDITDMVGMTRAHIADPHIVSKLINGEEDDVRPCVGAAYCIDRIYTGGEALCIHNPATGREYLGMPQSIEKKQASERTQNILVIGGGIAGLECARILAIRGHNVSLHEASKTFGGQIQLASKATWRKDLIGIVDWRVEQCKKLGVEMFTESLIDFDAIYDEYINVSNSSSSSGVDCIVIATGGVPNLDVIPEQNGQELCNSTWDILSGNVNIGKNVIIYDHHGNHHGPSCAEYIKSKTNNKSNVEIITPDRCIGQELGGTNYPVHLKNLYATGVKMTCDWHVTCVEKMDNKDDDYDDDGNRLKVTLRNEYDASIKDKRICDQVIVEHGTVPADNTLFEQLREYSINNGEVDMKAMINCQSCVKNMIKNENGQFYLLRIGDSLVSRNIHAAVLDALRMCKDI